MKTRDARLAITPEMTVNTLLEYYPETARIFVRRRMHCVGCTIASFESLAEACRIYQQPLDEMLAELRATARGDSHHPLAR
jgi:hybrid cluster-associated redox disulfide protein